MLMSLARKGAIFHVESSSPAGACYTTSSGSCVTDGGGVYGSNERCNITLLTNALLRSIEFATEIGYDWLSVDGQRFSGYDGA
jgi:hypothetical protein